MTHVTTNLIQPLFMIVEGNRYVMTVTGAESDVTLEFEPVADSGVWFPLPGVSVTPSSGVVYADFIAPVQRMRVKLDGPQVESYAITWVKVVTDNF